MQTKQIRELYDAAPFEPFEIVLPNGSAITVDHPEFMAFSRDYRTLHFYPLKGGTWHIDVKMITQITVPAQNGSERPRKRKR